MSAVPAVCADAQAIVRTGFGTLGAARYILLDVGDAPLARRWLAAFAPTTLGTIERERVGEARQIAISAPGLLALGLSAEELATFSPEFQLGMGHTATATRLGDIGGNAAEGWDWGAEGSEPHILVVLFARKAAAAALEEEFIANAQHSGLALRAVHVGDWPTDREPFGFRDGLSQPDIDWTPRRKTPRHAYDNHLALGELLMGYRDEYGLMPDSPTLRPGRSDSFNLGRNGSYLVFRRLAQDVKGFWQWMRAQASTESGAREGAAVRLAELMMGRGLDGAPLPGLEPSGEDANSFTFRDDPHGRLCPLASHVRRANPRMGDLPAGKRGFLGAIIDQLGFTGSVEADAVAASRFHRLVRRGRSYGQPTSIAEALNPATPERAAGLHFICLGTNIARQFEFVQGAWLASPRFAGLAGQGDPVVGSREQNPPGCPSDRFASVDGEDRLRLFSSIPRFVQVEAGGYFFLPSAAALREIAAIG